MDPTKLQKRSNEIERHFKWRQKIYELALKDGVVHDKAYLYANICTNIVLLGVEYDGELMAEAMKYCPEEFKKETEQLQHPEAKYANQTAYRKN